MTLVAQNPADGAIIAEYPETSPDEVREAILKAHETHLEWKGTSFGHRAQLMANAASILEERAREFGELMTREMGKPLEGFAPEAMAAS